MAFLTIHRPVFLLELSQVDILMAGDAVNRFQLVQHKFTGLAFIDFCMAPAARYLRVPALQREFGLLMVEAGFLPRGCLVARFTTVFCHILRKLALVNVLVTAETRFVLKFEHLLTAQIRNMANSARYSKVSAGQRVIGAVVVSNAEFCRSETRQVMTAFAASAISARRKLSQVNITMAVCAKRKP